MIHTSSLEIQFNEKKTQQVLNALGTPDALQVFKSHGVVLNGDSNTRQQSNDTAQTQASILQQQETQLSTLQPSLSISETTLLPFDLSVNFLSPIEWEEDIFGKGPTEEDFLPIIDIQQPLQFRFRLKPLPKSPSASGSLHDTARD